MNTQLLNQEYTEPFLAIVIDPIRTQAAGKVEIGAFRTYPKDYKVSRVELREKERDRESLALGLGLGFLQTC